MLRFCPLYRKTPSNDRDRSKVLCGTDPKENPRNVSKNTDGIKRVDDITALTARSRRIRADQSSKPSVQNKL